MTFIKLKWTLVLWLSMLPFSGFGQGGRSQQDSLALLLQKGTELIRQQNYEVLEQIISKGNTLLKQNQSTLSFSLIADFQSLTGRFYLLTHQEERWDDLYSWVVEHETQFKSQEEIGTLIRLLNNAGIAFKRLSRLTESQLAYVKATEALVHLKEPNYLLQGSLFNNAGTALKHLGEYDKAFDFFNQAITSLDRIILTASDPNLSSLSQAYYYRSQALNNLGLINQYLGNNSKAIAAFQEALRLKRKYDPAGVTMVASNMANSYIELNQLTEAE
ncbi:MAG: tetratricopeptide repeat protein, partial [Clostridia bacterium]|nr:tetratricopeptide repeat protein [Clostridia bacterium]